MFASSTICLRRRSKGDVAPPSTGTHIRQLVEAGVRLASKNEPQHVPDSQPPHAVRGLGCSTKVRSFYDLGVRVIERMEKDGVGLTEAVRRLKREEQVLTDPAKKARQFANAYQQKEKKLNQLVDLFDANPALSLDHLIRVLKLPVTEQMEWLKRAGQLRWSGRELDRHVKASDTEKVRKAGRRPKKPDSFCDSLDQVISHSQDWLKRFDAYWSQDDCWPRKVGIGEEEAATMVRQVHHAIEALERVRVSTMVLRKRLEPLTDVSTWGRSARPTQETLPEQPPPGTRFVEDDKG